MLNGPSSGGPSVTVTGLNFGGVDFTSSSTVSMHSCSTAAWTSSTAVACLWHKHVRNEASVQVTIHAQVGTDAAAFTFDAPLGSSILPLNLPASTHYSVTVSGLNFGMQNYSVTSMISNSACSTAAWTSQSTLACLPVTGVDVYAV